MIYTKFMELGYTYNLVQADVDSEVAFSNALQEVSSTG